MMSRIGLGVLCLLALAAPTRAGDGFTISYWCGPPPKFNTVEKYQEIKDAGFTVALNCCAVMDVAQNRQMLDNCQKVGIKAMVMDQRMVYSLGKDGENKPKLDAIVKDYSDHPALFGYYVVDEPGAGAFPGLGDVFAYLKEKDPKHPAYVNLLPTFALELGVLGTKTYEEYVRTYADKVKPFAISYDNYHLTNHGDRGGWFENLNTVRKVSVDTKTPFWNIVLAVQHGDYRNLTEPELRFEAMQTLAFGAHGLLWFTYWSPAETDNSTKWEHAIINPDGSRDPHYDMVKSINADLKAIGDVLTEAQSAAVYQVGGTPEVKGEPSGGIAPSGPGQFTVGVFKASDGKNLALVTNRDYTLPLNSQVTIAAKPATVEQFDPAKKSWSPAPMLDQGKGEVAIDLPAGAGVLLRW